MPTHPNVRRCIHTKVDGGACGAPAVKGKTHCRFHHHTHHLPKGNEPWTDPNLNPYHPDNNPENK